MNHEPELDADERDALHAWASCEVPEAFAERVAIEVVAGEIRRGRVAAPEQGRDEARRQAPESWAAWWIGMVAAAAAVLLALTLLARDDDAFDDAAQLAELRMAAELVLLRECTPCHLGGTQGAEPTALAAFDLGDARWDRGLSSAQLAIVVERVAERDDALELDGVRRYVSAELGRRGAGAR